MRLEKLPREGDVGERTDYLQVRRCLRSRDAEQDAPDVVPGGVGSSRDRGPEGLQHGGLVAVHVPAALLVGQADVGVTIRSSQFGSVFRYRHPVSIERIPGHVTGFVGGRASQMSISTW